jgi:hypothetical protein
MVPRESFDSSSWRPDQLRSCEGLAACAPYEW